MHIGKCADCGNLAMVGGRGLCKSGCYQYHHNHHTLDRFPRSTWKREDLMAEFDLCKARGLTVREAAEKIGVSLSALRKAILRQRKLTESTAALWVQDPLDRMIN